MLFGTDMPWDSQSGLRYVRETKPPEEDMDIPEGDKKKIFEEQCRKVFPLTNLEKYRDAVGTIILTRHLMPDSL